MIRPTRFIHSICLAGCLATAVSCDNTPGPLFPTLDLSLASQLGAKQDFFEGEPVYVAFSLSNHGSDTIWTRPFSFVIEWYVDGELTDSVGKPLYKFGGIASYFFPPSYRGEPLAPGRRRYQVWMVQDRWGLYRTDMVNTYGGHYLPPGRYTLRMHFPFDLPQRRVPRILYADPITFRVHARTATEEQSFQRLQDLMALAFSRDTVQRAAFGDSLMANVQSRSADDPIVPLLITGWGWAVGYWRDSLKLDELLNASSAVTRAQRATAAGAYAVIGVNELRPAAIPGLARELAGSLAGDVAASLINH